MQVKLLMKGIVCSACLYESEEQWLSTQSDTVGEPSSVRGLDSVWYAQTQEIARLVLNERGEEDVTQT